MADVTYSPVGVYHKQGSNDLVVTSTGRILVESSGQITLESGSTMTVESGATLDVDGTLTASGVVTVETGSVVTCDDGSDLAPPPLNAENVIGTPPSLHFFDIADGASGDQDITLTHKSRVLDAWVIKTGADGHATEDLIQITSTGGAITDSMAVGLLDDTGLTRAIGINDANATIAAGKILRTTKTKGSGGGNNIECEVYVLVARAT